MIYSIWRLIDKKPGCVDFLGEIEAPDLSSAEKHAKNDYPLDPSEYFDIQEEA